MQSNHKSGTANTIARLPVIDASPSDPAFYAAPYPHYAHWHAAHPTFHWSAYGQTAFSAHADVAALLRDPRFGRPPDPSQSAPPREGLDTFDRVDRLSLRELEAPNHTRIRRVINRSFVSRALGHVEPIITARADALADALQPGADLLAAYAEPIPVEMIAALLGVPPEDGARLVAWSHAMVAMYRLAPDAQTVNAAERASVEFAAYLTDHLDARNGTDANDVLGVLRTAEDVETLSRDEAISTAVLLLNAGHEATVHAIANGVVAILYARAEGFDPMAWLDGERLDQLVEECVRIDPPLHLFTRHAYEDVVWTDAAGRSVPIQKGEAVALLLGAACHDPRRFPEPARFNPTRSPNDHVAFGGGIHFCLGAPLARMEMRIALRVLFRCHPDLRLATEPKAANRFHFRGFEAVPVAF